MSIHVLSASDSVLTAGPSRRLRYDDDEDDDDYYYSSRRKRSPSPRYRRRSPSPSRHRTSSRRSPTPPPRSSHHASLKPRSDETYSDHKYSNRSPEARDRRDLPPSGSSSISRDGGGRSTVARDKDARGASSSSTTRPRQSISIALPSAASSSSASTAARRPLEAFSGSTSSSSSRPKAPVKPTAPPPAADKVPPFFYKPLKSKDYKVEYDPALDSNPIKKGKAVEYRYDGQGLPDDAGSKDPRGARSNLEQHLAAAKRHLHVKRVNVITYNVSPPSRDFLTPPGGPLTHNTMFSGTRTRSGPPHPFLRVRSWLPISPRRPAEMPSMRISGRSVGSSKSSSSAIPRRAAASGSAGSSSRTTSLETLNRIGRRGRSTRRSGKRVRRRTARLSQRMRSREEKAPRSAWPC